MAYPARIRVVNEPDGTGHGGTIETKVEESFDHPQTGVGYLYLSNDISSIPAGLRMRWKTDDLNPRGEPVGASSPR
jgi:hypothetical protein